MAGCHYILIDVQGSPAPRHMARRRGAFKRGGGRQATGCLWLKRSDGVVSHWSVYVARHYLPSLNVMYVCVFMIAAL